MSETHESSLFSPDSVEMYLAIGSMGTLAGIFAGWLVYNVDLVLFNLHASVWLFLVVWAATTAYFSYRRVPSGVLATGMYLLAWLVFLAPFAYYGPMLAEAKTQSLTGRAAAMLEAFQGLFWWGLLGGVLALTLAVIATGFRIRTRRLRSRRQRRALSTRLSTYFDGDEREATEEPDHAREN